MLVRKPLSWEPAFEMLEGRMLMSAAAIGAPAIVNASRSPGPQAEEAIAVNPADPSQVFLLSNNDGRSLFGARSVDGGRTWSGGALLTGADGFPQACCDPSLSWDAGGNLFLAYLREDTTAAELLCSTDGGVSFKQVASFKGKADQPTVTTSNGAVWVGFEQQPHSGGPDQVGNAGAVLYGAPVTGSGAVGRFKRIEKVSASRANVADIAVGPAGQVAVAYINEGNAPATISIRVDPDGLGPRPLGPVIGQISNNIGFPGYAIPAQGLRGIDAEAGLAYDLSPDGYTGRLYMACTDAAASGSAATNIYLRYSDNDGTTWSSPVQVNADTTSNSHFFSKLSVDPVSGAIGLTWYDARNDPANARVQLFGIVGTPSASGVEFSGEFVVQPAFSSAAAMVTSSGSPDPNQFGDYNGLSMLAGRMYAAWADNSNSTGDNPDGIRSADAYAGIVDVQVTPFSNPTLLGSFGDSHRLTFTNSDGTAVTLSLDRGRGYAFRDGANIDLRILDTTARSTVSVMTRGASRRIALGNVSIIGSIGTFQARTADLAGTFQVQGDIRRVLLRRIAGGTVAATGLLGKLVLVSANQS